MVSLLPPEEETEEAREGTAVHETGERLVRGFLDAEGALPTERPEIASNGVVVTGEMVERAEFYAMDVIDLMQETGIYGGAFLGIEKRLSMKRHIHEQCWGTGDFYLYDPVKLELHVWDYKDGFSSVSAEDNWQLICYALGAMDAIGIDGYKAQRVMVHFRIYQPRDYQAGPVKTWSCKASDLRGPANLLSNAAQQAFSADATCTTGEHCKHCKALHLCPAALRAGIELYEVADKPIPLEMEPVQLASMLTLIQRAHEHIGNIRDALETQVSAMLRAGSVVPGYGLAASVGNRRWVIDDAHVIELGRQAGLEIGKTVALSPSQAEKAGMDKALVANLTERPSGGQKLKKIDASKAFK
jgi:hypothetical protein